jgi:hypothetical protein
MGRERERERGRGERGRNDVGRTIIILKGRTM